MIGFSPATDGSYEETIVIDVSSVYPASLRRALECTSKELGGIAFQSR